MSDCRRHATRGSARTLLAAALAYAGSFVAPPSVDVAAVFAIAAVVLFATQALFDNPDSLAAAWTSPAAATAVVLVSDTTHDQRVTALVLAGFGVVGIAVSPVIARRLE